MNAQKFLYALFAVLVAVAIAVFFYNGFRTPINDQTPQQRSQDVKQGNYE